MYTTTDIGSLFYGHREINGNFLIFGIEGRRDLRNSPKRTIPNLLIPLHGLTAIKRLVRWWGVN